MIKVQGGGGPTFTVVVDDGASFEVDGSLTGAQAVLACVPFFQAIIDAAAVPKAVAADVEPEAPARRKSVAPKGDK